MEDHVRLIPCHNGCCILSDGTVSSVRVELRETVLVVLLVHTDQLHTYCDLFVDKHESDELGHPRKRVRAKQKA